MNIHIYIQSLKQAIAQLAAPYSIQIESVPEYVEAASDFASEFDAVKHLASQLYKGGYVSKRLLVLVFRIDSLLDSIQNDPSDLWTNEALRDAEKWEVVRRFARDALTELQKKL